MIAAFLVAALCLVGSGLADNSEFCQPEWCTLDYIPHCMTDGTIAYGCIGLKNAICEKNLVEQTSWTPETSCLPDGYCESDVCTADMIPHCMNSGVMVYGCSDLKQAVCQDGMVENRLWEDGQRCLPLNYCESNTCTKDMIEHCMTDGTVVTGCDALKKAVCNDMKTEQTGWTPSQACRPSDYCENLACTMDLIPHCLSDGSIVHGCHDLKQAICTKNLVEQMSWTPETSCLPDGYCESDVCTADMIPHCMNSGVMVYGCSDLKQAVCQDGMVENRLWEDGQRCLPLNYCESNTCTKDMIEHCMTDGTVVTGCDALKKAICMDNKWENTEWTSGTPCETQEQE